MPRASRPVVPRLSSLVALVATVLVLLGCGGVAAPAPPGDEQHVELRLGLFANLTQATALVGVGRGILARALGPAVTLRPSTFNAGPEAVEALLSNSVDASYLGPSPAINAFAQSHGQAVRVISGAASGGAALVVRPSIASAAELKGRVLATPQLGNTQDVALRYWLGQRGLRTTPEGAGDVSIRPQDNGQTLQTFRAGQVDGAWVPEPWATRLLVEGGGRLLVDERDRWPGGRFATTLLVVRTDFLRQHPGVVRRLLDGQVAADEFINGQPAEAQRAVNDAIGAITGKRLADEVVAQAWTRMTFTDDPIATSISDSAEHAHQVGLLGKVDLRGLLDLSLLNQALAARGRPGVAGL